MKRRHRQKSNSLTSFVSTDGTSQENSKNYSNRWKRNNGLQKVSPHVTSTFSVPLIRVAACVHNRNMAVIRTATGRATVQLTVTLRTTVTTVANTIGSSCNISRVAPSWIDIVESMHGQQSRLVQHIDVARSCSRGYLSPSPSSCKHHGETQLHSEEPKRS